jgi:hypothetical protein
MATFTRCVETSATLADDPKLHRNLRPCRATPTVKKSAWRIVKKLRQFAIKILNAGTSNFSDNKRP